MYLCFLARLRENGWTNFHEIFREDAESPWNDLIQFWVNSEKPRNAAMLISFTLFVNITSKRLDRFAWNFQGRCGVTTGRPDYIFGQFRCATRGRGLLCFRSTACFSVCNSSQCSDWWPCRSCTLYYKCFSSYYYMKVIKVAFCQWVRS